MSNEGEKMREIIEKKITGSPEDQVDLGEMSIKDDEIAEIIQFIAKTRPKVEELFLNDNLLSDEGATVLSKGLASLKQLSRLDLQNNAIGKEGISAIYTEKNQQTRLALHGNRIKDDLELEEIKRAVFRK